MHVNYKRMVQKEKYAEGFDVIFEIIILPDFPDYTCTFSNFVVASSKSWPQTCYYRRLSPLFIHNIFKMEFLHETQSQFLLWYVQK